MENVVEPTCKETQEVKDTTKYEHIECRLLEIEPGKERASLFRRLEPSAETLKATLLSRCRLS